VLTVGTLARGNGVIRLRLVRLRPRWHTMWRIVRIGVPSLAEAGGMWIGNIVVIGIVRSLGNDAAIGAHGASIRIEALSFLPGFALATAASTLMGQYLGLGDAGRARRAVGVCLGAGICIMALIGVLFVSVPWHLARTVTDQPELLAIMPKLIRIAGYVQVFLATAMVLSHSLRGAGDTRTTMLITLSSTYLLRVPGCYVAGVLLGGGIVGIWYVMCSEWAVRAAVFYLRFRHGGWARVTV